MTLYTYGDSFTAGDGTRRPLLNKNNKPMRVPNPNRRKFWVDEVARKYSILNIDNRGAGGLSDDGIFYKLLADLKKFKRGDIILYSLGFPERTDFILKEPTRELLDPSKEKAGIEGAPLFCVTTSTPNEDTFTHFKRAIQESNFEENMPFCYSDDLLVAMINYNSNYKTKNSELLTATNKFRAKLVLDYLKTKGVNSLIWDLPPQVYKYENISKATKGKIDDHHWSWEGCYQFSKWMIKQINKVI